MITSKTQFQNGELKILGLGSVAEVDLECAEKEIFYNVFKGVNYNDVNSLEDTDYVKILFANILVPFVFVQFSKNRNAFLAMQGEVTEGATAYGRTTTSRLLEVWNNGVSNGKRVFEDNKEVIIESFENCAFIAKLKL